MSSLVLSETCFSLVQAKHVRQVPFTEGVKISSTNVTLETTVPQKEETFQVVIDLIKNSSCFKAFTISADVPEIFIQQFWYSIKKVQGTNSYDFILANKKCVVNADVFRTILDICPRVEGVNFTDVLDDDTTLAFLIKLGYKIDHRKERRSRRENMPFLRFTKIIINHFLKQHKSLSNLKYQHYHTIKDDGIVSRLKFVRIGKDYQEYELVIPEIPPKKSRGKGSQRKKTADDSQETGNVSKPKPEPVKRNTASRRVVKKKVTISADDNIIFDDPNVALELGKSISKTKVEEAEAPRQVHATHARIVAKFVPEPTKRRKLGKMTSDPPKKLKGVPSLTLKELEVAHTMQALKESRKTSRRQPGTRGSNEGTGTIPRVPDESTVVSATSKSEYSKQDQIGDEEKDDKDDDVDDEGDDYICDKQDADDKDAETESDEDGIYKYKIRVRKDEDVEMSNAKVKDSDKGDEEVADAAKADAEKTLEVKDDAKKTELPPTSSSLSISSVKIQSEVPHIQSPSMLRVPVIVISEPFVLTPLQESPSIANVTTLPPPSVSTTPPVPLQTTTLIPTPPITTDAATITTAVSESDALSVVYLRVAKLEKYVSKLKKIDLSALKTQVPSVVDNYLRSKVRDVFQKELKKHIAYLI
ncbi:hypothetical protein Tco_0001134 [Tanacetum coccineum]